MESQESRQRPESEVRLEMERRSQKRRRRQTVAESEDLRWREQGAKKGGLWLRRQVRLRTRSQERWTVAEKTG